MSTNGAFGFIIDGQRKIAYNHFDSYPGGLGLDVLRWLRNELVTNPHALPIRVRNLRVVDEDIDPTDEDFAQLKAVLQPQRGRAE